MQFVRAKMKFAASLRYFPLPRALVNNAQAYGPLNRSFQQSKSVAILAWPQRLLSG